MAGVLVRFVVFFHLLPPLTPLPLSVSNSILQKLNTSLSLPEASYDRFGALLIDWGFLP